MHKEHTHKVRSPSSLIYKNKVLLCPNEQYLCKEEGQAHRASIQRQSTFSSGRSRERQCWNRELAGSGASRRAKAFRRTAHRVRPGRATLHGRPVLPAPPSGPRSPAPQHTRSRVLIRPNTTPTVITPRRRVHQRRDPHHNTASPPHHALHHTQSPRRAFATRPPPPPHERPVRRTRQTRGLEVVQGHPRSRYGGHGSGPRRAACEGCAGIQ